MLTESLKFITHVTACIILKLRFCLPWLNDFVKDVGIIDAGYGKYF